MSAFTAAQRAELRDAFARSRIEAEDWSRQRIQEQAAQKRRPSVAKPPKPASKPRPVVHRVSPLPFIGPPSVHPLPADAVQRLNEPDAQQLVQRLRMSLCPDSTVELLDHARRVAWMLLSLGAKP